MTMRHFTFGFKTAKLLFTKTNSDENFICSGENIDLQRTAESQYSFSKADRIIKFINKIPRESCYLLNGCITCEIKFCFKN